jgi:hypothetical protein
MSPMVRKFGGAAADPAMVEESLAALSAGANAFRSTIPTAVRAHRRGAPIAIQIFLISLILPIILYAGPIRLSPYRLVLLCTFIPCVSAWSSGALGKKRLPDLLFLFFSLWGALALSVNHGLPVGLQSGAILLIETFGAYLLGRKLVKDASSFEAMVRALFWIIVILVPFAIFETLTSRKIFLELLGEIFTVPPPVLKDPRWGLSRVQGPFEHQILFGVFCSTAFGLSFYVLGYGQTVLRRLWRVSLVAMQVFLSLSSGPLAGIVVQTGLIGWDITTRRLGRRWLLLSVIIACAYVILNSLSHRSPLEVLMDYAFDPFTAYGRILIWQYGSAEVVQHPLFGIGFNSWHHPTWISDSMDMFWLVNAAYFGLPAALFFTSSFIIILMKLGQIRSSDAKLLDYRKGVIITMVGLFVAGWCVHFWNAIYVLMMFLLGSSIWMLSAGDNSTARSAYAPRHRRATWRGATGKAVHVRQCVLRSGASICSSTTL